MSYNTGLHFPSLNSPTSCQAWPGNAATHWGRVAPPGVPLATACPNTMDGQGDKAAWCPSTSGNVGSCLGLPSGWANPAEHSEDRELEVGLGYWSSSPTSPRGRSLGSYSQSQFFLLKMPCMTFYNFILCSCSLRYLRLLPGCGSSAFGCPTSVSKFHLQRKQESHNEKVSFPHIA